MSEANNLNEIMNQALTEIRDHFKGEFSDAEIRELAMQMMFYLGNGAPYGEEVEHFYRWYKERGGTIGETDRN